jgi:hypothetical protein
MARARWPRTVAKARRVMAWLETLDVETREPANFDVHPDYRNGRTSAIVEVSPVGADVNQASGPAGPKTGE